ncbi:MAG: DUF1232 domain-containing protein [Saprospiraceae bacterium]|nr:DUF1232 domain-containing protein [Saprospiraceae bacterium]
MIKILKVLSFVERRLKTMGTRLVYSVLLMIYAYKAERTPAWARRIILGSLAYLLSPLDSIPDLTPIFGFTDDLGVISFGLVTIACYIDADVRAKARIKIYSLFKQVDESELLAVDEKL